MRTIAVLASLLLATACCRSRGATCCPRPAAVPRPAVVVAPDSTASRPLAPLDVAGPGYRGVILAPKPGGWVPTPEQVAALEARLPNAMQQHAPEFHEPLNGYFRQYIGTFEDGRRIIDVHGATLELIKSFEIEDGFDSREDELQVNDGGDDLFEARYDPASGTFDSAGPHGEA